MNEFTFDFKTYQPFSKLCFKGTIYLKAGKYQAFLVSLEMMLLVTQHSINIYQTLNRESWHSEKT